MLTTISAPSISTSGAAGAASGIGRGAVSPWGAASFGCTLSGLAAKERTLLSWSREICCLTCYFFFSCGFWFFFCWGRLLLFHRLWLSLLLWRRRCRSRGFITAVRWPFAFAQPRRARSADTAECFRGGLRHAGVFVRVLAFRKLHPETLDAHLASVLPRVSCAAVLPASSRSYAMYTRRVPCLRKASR